MPRPKNDRRPEEPRLLSDLLRVTMGRDGLLGAKRRLDAWRRAWVDAAGETLAGHTHVRGCQRGTLSIEVDGAALCHELAAFHRDGLLTRLREQHPDLQIRDLHFRLGDLSQPRSDGSSTLNCEPS